MGQVSYYSGGSTGRKGKVRTARQPFIGAIGAIDCTYVKILASQHEEAYVNHWGDHILNVQVYINK